MTCVHDDFIDIVSRIDFFANEMVADDFYFKKKSHLNFRKQQRSHRKTAFEPHLIFGYKVIPMNSPITRLCLWMFIQTGCSNMEFLV